MDGLKTAHNTGYVPLKFLATSNRETPDSGLKSVMGAFVGRKCEENHTSACLLLQPKERQIPMLGWGRASADLVDAPRSGQLPLDMSELYWCAEVVAFMAVIPADGVIRQRIPDRATAPEWPR